MEKIMNFDDDWEVVLEEDGFLEFNHDGGNEIFSRKYNIDYDDHHEDDNNDPYSMTINMDYFTCSQSNISQFVDSSGSLLPLINEGVPKVNIESPLPLTPNDAIEPPSPPSSISQFVNSPKNAIVPLSIGTNTIEPTRVFEPRVDVGEPYKVEFSESTKKNDGNIIVSSSSLSSQIIQENEGFNLWSWSLNGIGAICSFGVAAATTICIIFIENQQKHKRHAQNHKIRFQIFTDNKRIKEDDHHATKLKETISTMRGPFTRAHITFGGSCEAF